MTAGPSLWKRQRLLTMSWQTLGTLLTGLAEEIRAAGPLPDTVVGITRGGLTPAVALAHRLDVPEFRIMGIPRNSSNSRYSERGAAALEYVVPDTPLTGKRVLVVDDIMGDGGTMETAVGTLRALDAAEIRTAVLVRNQNCAGRPDHQGVEVDDWTVFPWEAPPGPAEPTVPLEAVR
ncbi:phosphoribosyltransferase family protein [Streptomyces sp. NPDC052496]|uniref:ToyH n=1 Tax=Streptomyces rimosus TaxID=1927 RepID=B6CWJ1_STRRM|nr:ToyH [Streptomyces rimosus]